MFNVVCIRYYCPKVSKLRNIFENFIACLYTKSCSAFGDETWVYSYMYISSAFTCIQ
jgi:hypothetical protein